MAANTKNNRPGLFLRFWLPVLAWMGLIFYFSCLPAKDIPRIFSYQDVACHAVTYAVLAYLFARALKAGSLKISSVKIVYFTLLFGIIYGLSDEFHQMFVPGRNVSGADLIVDGVGSLIGSIVYR